jgi:anti-anti-sigma factor
VNGPARGYPEDVEEPMSAGTREPDEHAGTEEPQVTSVLEGDTAVVTVVGDLTEAARRPLVRAVTDLLLGVPGLRRVELHLQRVGFMNSGGMAVLVQLQRLGQPRAVELVLVGPADVVARPLQLAGLWHRFTVVEDDDS